MSIAHIYTAETDAFMDKLLREYFRKEPSVDEKARLDAEYVRDLAVLKQCMERA